MPDLRNPGEHRYEFAAVLQLICVAMLCGCKNPNQIATWGAGQIRAYLRLLGFKRGNGMRKSALYELTGRIDAADLEEHLMKWVEKVLTEMKAEYSGIVSREIRAVEAVAMDGKALRGSKKQGSDLSHLLSAVKQEVGMTLMQVPVDGKTNEIPLPLALVQRIQLEGRVLTVEALLTRRAIAEAIVQKGGIISCR